MSKINWDQPIETTHGTPCEVLKRYTSAGREYVTLFVNRTDPYVATVLAYDDAHFFRNVKEEVTIPCHIHLVKTNKRLIGIVYTEPCAHLHSNEALFACIPYTLHARQGDGL